MTRISRSCGEADAVNADSVGAMDGLLGRHNIVDRACAGPRRRWILRSQKPGRL
jgi:hypothetical protein